MSIFSLNKLFTQFEWNHWSVSNENQSLVCSSSQGWHMVLQSFASLSKVCWYWDGITAFSWISPADKAQASSLCNTYPTLQSCLWCSRMFSRGQLVYVVFIRLHASLCILIIQEELSACFHFIMHEIIKMKYWFTHLCIFRFKKTLYFHIIWLSEIFTYYAWLLKRVRNTRLESVLAIVLMQSKPINNFFHEYIMTICLSVS